MVSIGSILLFAPFLVLVLFLTSRALVSQLNRVVELLSRVSEGDLTKKLSLGNNPNDEFNTLGRATNQMIDNIGVLMKESIAGTRDLIEVHHELEKTMVRLTQNNEIVESQTISGGYGQSANIRHPERRGRTHLSGRCCYPSRQRVCAIRGPGG
ncbi:MAG: methyl-accepting chemotaxis protein [Marinobacter sp.]|nr:methyl-accepting chemotaxis protein [Marinobacter sp.]